MSDLDTSKVLDLICGSCALGTTKAEPSMACADGRIIPGIVTGAWVSKCPIRGLSYVYMG